MSILRQYIVLATVDNDADDKDLFKLLSEDKPKAQVLQCIPMKDKFSIFIDGSIISEMIPPGLREPSEDELDEISSMMNEYLLPYKTEIMDVCNRIVPQAVKDYMRSKGVRILDEDEALYYGRTVRQAVDLDNNSEATEQLDVIDNASFELARTLVETTGESLEWDMSIIGEINDVVIKILREHGHYVWYPEQEE